MGGEALDEFVDLLPLGASARTSSPTRRRAS